jgi:flagellum-specific ATP synthase
MSILADATATLHSADLARRHGFVSNLIGLIVEATGLQSEIGEVCLVDTGRSGRPVCAEVVGFRDGRTLLMPLGELHGIGPGTRVQGTGRPFRVAVGPHLLGRVIDGLGNPLDELDADGVSARPLRVEGALADPHNIGSVHNIGSAHERPQPAWPVNTQMRSTLAPPPAALSRPRISERVGLGVRALDGLVPCGKGQRLGIFAGSGVGKSSLLGMIARSTSASVNVIALVGERGREVREFIERDLGDALARSVVVVATSDQPALVRIKAAFTATTIAEYFRDCGHDVMLMMDSVTRFATAQREVGLAIGEPPATRGYTPSVFALLPRLLERAGTSPRGSITGLYTVLVDGDDMNEPVADAVRSILDGHVVLTRTLAHAGHYPAIDVSQSVSRLLDEVVAPEVVSAGRQLRAALAALREKEDLIAIGAYTSGSDPLLDAALAHRPRIEAFLRQATGERSRPEQADTQLIELAASLQSALGAEITAEAVLDVSEVAQAAAPSPPLGAAIAQSGAPAIPALHLDL